MSHDEEAEGRRLDGWSGGGLGLVMLHRKRGIERQPILLSHERAVDSY